MRLGASLSADVLGRLLSARSVIFATRLHRLARAVKSSLPVEEIVHFVQIALVRIAASKHSMLLSPQAYAVQ